MGKGRATGTWSSCTEILFEAGSARLRHLNHSLHIGVGQRTATGMITEVFAVS